jgi:ubiquinone/menaquinone biosynthesis C-methylase UbiE
MRALDVGCGPGALTAALAERLGAPKVSGADPSEPSAEACRARLPGVEIVVASAESLPFADGSFDAVLSQLVVNFMRDPHAGVREMRRVTCPGGIVAACVWDYAAVDRERRILEQAGVELRRLCPHPDPRAGVVHVALRVPQRRFVLRLRRR